MIAKCLAADVSRPGAGGPREAEALTELRAALADLAGASDLSRVSPRSIGGRLRSVVGKRFPITGVGHVSLTASENRDGIRVYSLDVEAVEEPSEPRASGEKREATAGFAGFSGVPVGSLGGRLHEGQESEAEREERESFDA